MIAEKDDPRRNVGGARSPAASNGFSAVLEKEDPQGRSDSWRGDDEAWVPLSEGDCRMSIAGEEVCGQLSIHFSTRGRKLILHNFRESPSDLWEVPLSSVVGAECKGFFRRRLELRLTNGEVVLYGGDIEKVHVLICFALAEI